MSIILDPDGDLVITLIPTTEPFAEWVEATDLATESEASQNGPEADPESQTLTEGLEVTNLEQQQEQIPTPEPNPTFLVSLKHLCLASSRFRKMMTGPWIETKMHPDGRRYLTMEGFDIEAFTIVLRVIHGRSGKVPRQLDIDTYGKIAVVVDDLDCLEPFHVWSELWAVKLKNPVPYCARTMIIWLFVSYVFRQAKKFKKITQTAIFRSDGPIPTLGLPIRDKIICEYRPHFPQGHNGTRC